VRVGTKEEIQTQSGFYWEWEVESQILGRRPKMPTKVKEEIGPISETLLSWSCIQRGKNGRKQYHFEKRSLKYPLHQKIVRNIILQQNSITRVARKKKLKFMSHFVWLSKWYPKCQFHMEFLVLFKSSHCVIFMYESVYLCTIHAHAHKSAITHSFL